MFELTAKVRENTKKGASKKYRREGLIPSIIYGGKENKNILINGNEFVSIHPELTRTTPIKIKLDGKDYEALVKDFQKDHLKDEFIHLDFFEITKGKRIRVEMPIKFVGNSVGVRAGGTLEKHFDRIFVECLPKDMVSHIDVDITNLNLGDIFHVSDLEIDESKIKILTKKDEVVAKIAGKKQGAETTDEEGEEEEEVEEEEE